jgi:hypothetical protein
MIHDPPLIRPLGDCYVAVEFGDEAALELNFRVLALVVALEKRRVRGVVDIIPTLRELAVTYDRSESPRSWPTLSRRPSISGSCRLVCSGCRSGTTTRGRELSPSATASATTSSSPRR